MIDLSADCHIHTAFSAGRDSVSVLVASAEQAGLTELTFADRVGPDTSWLAPYLAAIQRAQQRTDLVLHRGVEVEAIGIDGWLAFPSDLNGLEVISVGLNRLPLPAGLLTPDVVRALVDGGTMRPLDVVEQVITVLALAVERVSRYAPTRLARPLDFLLRSGIDLVGADLATREVDGMATVEADVRELPFDDRWFDQILLVSTLEHIGADNEVYGLRTEPDANARLVALRELRNLA